MVGGHGGGRLSFLDRRPPPGFDLRYVHIAPGSHLPGNAEAWRDALVVVERGEIEIEGRSGVRRRFVAGDVLCFEGLSLRALHNRGTDEAVLSAVARRRSSGSRRRVGESG
jgi:hypothetical protein